MGSAVVASFGRWQLAMLMVVLLAPPASAQSWDDYLSLLDAYATNPTHAVNLMTAPAMRQDLLAEHVTACLPRVVQFAGDTSPCRGVRRSLAVVLHTAAAVKVDVTDDALSLFHLQQARRLVDQVRQPALTEKWYELAVMFLLSRGSVQGASALADDMAGRFTASAVPHYLRGVVKEVGVMFDYGNLRDPLPAGRAGATTRRTLESSIGDYERALRQDETLVDARLHWGHVRSLLGESGAEAALLLVAGSARRADTRYLANLFLGSLAERSGKIDAALRHYESARGIEPRAQTACVATSQLLQMRARSDRAAAVARECLDMSGGDDPWWSYRLGAYDSKMVDDLRAMALRPQ